MPLDRDLIDHGADRTVVMANGCLCCNLAGDMEDAVMRLFSRREANDLPRFERLIIEPSGLSDPAPIAQAILRNPVIARSMRLEAIVTTVDALFAEAQIARHPETRKQIAAGGPFGVDEDRPCPGGGRAAAAGRSGGAQPGRADPWPPMRRGGCRGAVPAAFLDPRRGAASVARTARRLFADDPGHAGAMRPSVCWPTRRCNGARSRPGCAASASRHAEALLRVKGMLHIEG